MSLNNDELKQIGKWANQHRNRKIESKIGKMMKKPLTKREEKIDNNVALLQFDINGYPQCENHGAMNCINKARSAWRCSECGKGVSFESVPALDKWLKIHQEENKQK